MAPRLDAALTAVRWLPDVFAELWLVLDPAEAANDDFKYDRPSLLDDAVEAIAAQKYPTLPQLLEDHLRRATAMTLQRRIYEVMASIDEAFEAIYPWQDRVVSGGLKTIFDHYSIHGRYDSVSRRSRLMPTSLACRRANVLKPKVVGPSNPTNRASLFHNLFLYVPPDASAQPLEFSCSPGYSFGTGPPLTVRVGIAPLAEQRADAAIELLPTTPVATFRVAIDAAQEQVLADRARRVLESFESNGVHCAIFPELVITPLVRQAIVSTLHARAARRTLGSPNLQLVIAGSGYVDADSSGRAFNEASVFDGTGEELFAQRKINRYTMPDDLASRVSADGDEVMKARAIRDAAGTAGNLIEHMRVGNRLRVHDSPLGRMMVLICEDLAHPEPGQHACTGVGADWVFVPVMDTGLDERRWTARDGGYLAERGATVIVANSLYLERFSTRTGPIGFGLHIPCKHSGRRRPDTVVLTIDRSDPNSPVCQIVDCQVAEIDAP